MNKEYFPVTDKWVFPNNALAKALEEIALTGKVGNEGLVFLLGKRSGNDAIVSHVIGLRGRGIKHYPLRLDVSPELFNEVTDYAIENDLTMLGQIHAHPGTFVELSAVDREYGIKTPSFLSIVAPYYGIEPKTSIQECGVFVFDFADGYIGLTQSEVETRIILDNAKTCKFALVGG